MAIAFSEKGDRFLQKSCYGFCAIALSLLSLESAVAPIDENQSLRQLHL
jgi:hypothetical protein